MAPTSHEYSVKAVTGRRPFAVQRDGKTVELHQTHAAAFRAAERLNGHCSFCGANPHRDDCPVRMFERDPEFGADYDDSDAPTD